MKVDRDGVHRRHCCVKHGCKYCEDDTCIVVTGAVKQDYPCEDCDNEPSDLEKLKNTFDEIGLTYEQVDSYYCDRSILLKFGYNKEQTLVFDGKGNFQSNE